MSVLLCKYLFDKILFCVHEYGCSSSENWLLNARVELLAGLFTKLAAVIASEYFPCPALAHTHTHSHSWTLIDVCVNTPSPYANKHTVHITQTPGKVALAERWTYLAALTISSPIAADGYKWGCHLSHWIHGALTHYRIFFFFLNSLFIDIHILAFSLQVIDQPRVIRRAMKALWERVTILFPTLLVQQGRTSISNTVLMS